MTHTTQSPPLTLIILSLLIQASTPCTTDHSCSVVFTVAINIGDQAKSRMLQFVYIFKEKLIVKECKKILFSFPKQIKNKNHSVQMFGSISLFKILIF